MSLVRAGLAAAIASGVVMGAAVPADAWVHDIGVRSYFAPGPEPGPALSFCHVSTQLGKAGSGDYANIFINDHPDGRGCAQAFIQIVTWDGSTLMNSEWQATARVKHGEARSAGATGPMFAHIVGANVQEQNVFGYWQSWQISAF